MRKISGKVNKSSTEIGFSYDISAFIKKKKILRKFWE